VNWKIQAATFDNGRWTQSVGRVMAGSVPRCPLSRSPVTQAFPFGISDELRGSIFPLLLCQRLLTVVDSQSVHGSCSGACKPRGQRENFPSFNLRLVAIHQHYRHHFSVREGPMDLLPVWPRSSIVVSQPYSAWLPSIPGYV
jgi:hypothetical protein